MKILYLTHNIATDNGGGRFASEFIFGIALHIGVTPVVGIRKGDARDGVFSIFKYPKYRVLKNLRHIASLARACDLVHAFDVHPYGVIALMLRFWLGKPYVITAQGTGSVQPFYSWMYPIASLTCLFASRVVAISNFTKARMLAAAPFLAIGVVPHGVDAAKFASVRPVRHDLEERVSPLKPYILTVGMLKPRKGHADSIAAFAVARGTLPDLSYVIVGVGTEEYKEFLVKRAAELGVGDRVHVFSNIKNDEEVAYFYHNAELFILLPRYDRHDFEGFGLVFLEAASAGLPVVGSRAGGVADAMKEGENGILVDEGDAPGAARAITDILASPATRLRYAKSSLRFAREMTWEKTFGIYAKIYTDVIRQP